MSGKVKSAIGSVKPSSGQDRSGKVGLDQCQVWSGQAMISQIRSGQVMSGLVMTMS